MIPSVITLEYALNVLQARSQIKHFYTVVSKRRKLERISIRIPEGWESYLNYTRMLSSFCLCLIISHQKVLTRVVGLVWPPTQVTATGAFYYLSYCWRRATTNYAVIWVVYLWNTRDNVRCAGVVKRNMTLRLTTYIFNSIHKFGYLDFIVITPAHSFGEGARSTPPIARYVLVCGYIWNDLGGCWFCFHHRVGWLFSYFA